MQEVDEQYTPRKKEFTSKLLLQKRLNIKDDPEPYKRACELVECMMKKDWIKYGSMLSEREVRMGLQEIKNPSISAQQYRTEIIPTEMRQNRGPYTDLVDYELQSEHVVNENEVMFVFRFTYSHQAKLLIEDETIWAVRERIELTEEDICTNESQDQIARDSEWKLSFHGGYGGGFVSCLQMNWWRRLINACAVVPSYNDTM
jgi:hypothetical protein